MAKLTSKPGNRVLLLCSYCHENDNCTDDFPCDACLKMCNIATITEKVVIEVHGGFEYMQGLSC